MTDRKEHNIVAQWISSTKDSVFISEEMLFYGVFDSGKNGDVPSQEIVNKLASIPLSYLKVLEIDTRKKTTTLEYGNKSGSTVLIRWENPDFMSEFKKFMMRRFPGSFTLFREDKVKFKTRGSIVALVIIPIIYFLALVAGTFNSQGTWRGGGKIGSEAVVALFQALASMGVLKLTLLFGGLFGIALLALFRARKTSSDITIIHLR